MPAIDKAMEMRIATDVISGCSWGNDMVRGMRCVAS
jgi:hypothetical protein